MDSRSKSTGSSKGSSGRSSSQAHVAASTAGATVPPASKHDTTSTLAFQTDRIRSLGSLSGEPADTTESAFLQSDQTAAYDAAAIVHYSSAERAALRASAALTADRLEIARAGPGFVQSGLSSFGALLCVRRESEAGASVSLGEKGSDVWLGITSGGYLVVWSGGCGVEGPSHLGVDATLLDFERLLGEQYTRACGGCFLAPRLGGGNKKGVTSVFILTEEGHGWTFQVEVGIVVEQAKESEQRTGQEQAASPVKGSPVGMESASSVKGNKQDSTKRVGIIAHRRLLMKKAMYVREYVPASVTSYGQAAAAASAPSRPSNVQYHPQTNSILLTLDTDLYAYSADTLQTLWTLNIGPTILGGLHAAIAASEGEAAGSGGGGTGGGGEEKHSSTDKRPSVSSAVGQGIRLDPKQRKAHAITALTAPALLNLDQASLIAAASVPGSNLGVTNLPPASPTSPNANSSNSSNGGGGNQPAPPPFFLLGTKSGYLLQVLLRKREVLIGLSKLAPECRILSRFSEHHLMYPGMLASEAEKEVTGEQREELARKREERRKIELASGNTISSGTGPTGSGAGAGGSAPPLPRSGSNVSVSAAELDTPSADGDIASFPGADGGEPSRDGPDSSPNDNFDLSDLPIGPLLICSPSFDLSSPSPPATIRTSSYSTTITCLGVVLRRGEWVIVVGCADGFVHLVSRESRARYLAGRGIAEGRAADEIKDSKYARYIHPHPIDLPAGFPASLLYTLADPSPHGTTTKMPPCLQLVCSLDGGMIITIDGAGTIRRWDLNNRALSGVTHTDGLVESVQTGSSHLFGQAHHSALHGQHLPVWMDLIYPSSQSDLAVLYGAGGALQGMHGGGGRDSQPSRSGSFSMRASEEGLEGLMRPGAINSLLSSSADPSSSPPLSTKGSHSPSAASTVLSPALLLSQGLLLPTHVVIFSSGTWSLFRTTRAPRVSKHASSQAAQNSKTGIAGSGSGLLADIADFLAASYLDARKTMDSLGPSQGDKLRKERAAVEARAAAARKRSQNLQARDGMTSTETAGGGRESMNSGFGSPDSLHTSTSFHQSSTSPPVSPPHSAVLPAGTHISLSATPFHPGGLEVSSLASTRPASAGRGGEMVGLEGKIEVEGEEEVPQEREQAEPIRPVKVSEFFGFDLPTEETGGSGDMAGGQMNGPLGAGNGSSSEPKTGSSADITIRLDGHDGADHAQHQEQEEAAQE